MKEPERQRCTACRAPIYPQEIADLTDEPAFAWGTCSKNCARIKALENALIEHSRMIQNIGESIISVIPRR